MAEKKQYTFIDLFSGCGGMSLGFEWNGFKELLAIDNWKDALATYEYNRKNTHTLCADLSCLSPDKVKDDYNITNVDVIIGGPPCQGFSVAGKRIIEDERNKLYKSFVDFVKCFHPKAFVMENVPNILSIGGGIVKDSIMKDFEAIGYTVNVQVMTASDYGVPQNRRRAVFVGFADGTKYSFLILCVVLRLRLTRLFVTFLKEVLLMVPHILWMLRVIISDLFVKIVMESIIMT